MLKNLVKLSGGRCPNNEYQGFYQKTGQCWLDAISMALIFGGDTSDTIIKGILDYNNKDFIREKLLTNPTMIPINYEEAQYELLVNHTDIYLNNVKARLQQTLTNTEITFLEDGPNKHSREMIKEIIASHRLPLDTPIENIEKLIHRKVIDDLDKPTPLYVSKRRGSMDQSIKSHVAAISISEVNLIRSGRPIINMAGGGLIESVLSIIYLYNFLFLNLRQHIMPLNIINNHNNKKYINYNGINLDQIFAIFVVVNVIIERKSIKHAILLFTPLKI